MAGEMLGILLVCLLLAGCGRAPLYKQTEWIMGTSVTIQVADIDKNKKDIERAVNKAFERVKQIDTRMSIYKKDSQISLLNKNREAKLTPDTIKVLERAIEISKLTKGIFDVTAFSLVSLWGFVPKTPHGNERLLRGNEKLPSEDEINKALSYVDYNSIIINSKTNIVKLSKDGIKVDLGGIAKGYAVDEAIRVLQEHNISNALVNAGGDIKVIGYKSKNIPWTIGLQDPENKHNVLKKIKLTNKAIATSGNYENFIEINGRKYSHIIDLQTGYPVDNNITSVTIIANSCMDADAFATAVFIMGKEDGEKFIGELKDIEGEIIIKK